MSFSQNYHIICDSTVASPSETNSGSDVVMSSKEDTYYEEEFGELETLVEYDEEVIPAFESTTSSSSEWVNEHLQVFSAFEGTTIMDESTTLKQLLEWCTPIVWRAFIRLGSTCHIQHAPLPAQPPSGLTRLLHQSMPFYKDAPTRAIILTYALLYMARTRICFHCTHTQQQSSTAERDAALRCTLFFGVGVQFAGVWLLDCCPSDLSYWQRYVKMIPKELGAAWSRLVLQDWKYDISVTREDWMRYCSRLLLILPFETISRPEPLGLLSD